MIPAKDTNSFVPITPGEIARDVRDALELGITMVHLHARDPSTGAPTHRHEVYGEIIERIRAFSEDLVICVSLSGRHVGELDKRAEPLQLDGWRKPDMASLTLSSMNFSQVASVNSPSTIQDLARLMQEKGVLAELEVFDVGMINYAHYLASKGMIEPPYYFNLLLGNIASSQVDLLHLAVLLRDLPPRSLWSLGAIGDAQLAMNTVAIACGGGVRVGLEDNIWLDRGRTQLASNLDLIRRIHALAELHGRRVMTPARLREQLGLEPGAGRFGRRSQASSLL